MRRHIGEFLKTGLANTGRAAGSGIAEDKYSEESGPGNVYRRRTPVLIAERELPREESPVVRYFIEPLKQKEEV